MNLKQYQDLQVKLDEYSDYMVNEIRNSVVGLDIEDLEEIMETLGLYNKYKEEL